MHLLLRAVPFTHFLLFRGFCQLSVSPPLTPPLLLLPEIMRDSSLHCVVVQVNQLEGS
jgi:hypothetical protein